MPTPCIQAQAPREMMILLALLLLVDLPRVETNVTVSGTQGKAGSLGLLL